MTFDEWAHGEQTSQARQDKVQNFLKPNVNLASGSAVLRYWRYFQLTVWIFLEIYDQYMELTAAPIDYDHKWYGFTKLTNWSFYLYFTWLVIACRAHINYEVFGNALPKDSDSPWSLWKMYTIFYENSCNAHLVVTIFYWTLIYPTDTVEQTINHYGKHTFPLAFLVVDSYFNQIAIVANHFVFAITYTGTYAIFLVTYTLNTGIAIYDIADLKTPTSWGIVVFIWLSSAGLHFLLMAVFNSSFFLSVAQKVQNSGKAFLSQVSSPQKDEEAAIVLIVLP